jgi:phosphohistidine phosphatase
MCRKPAHYFSQSAVVPYRRHGGKVQILLITSRNRKRWVVPKGVRELDLSPAESAAQEALEEAGIRGRVSKESVGSYVYRKWGGTCTVELFVMKVESVLDEWQESERDREWLAPEEAAARVNEAELARLILAVARQVSGD